MYPRKTLVLPGTAKVLLTQCCEIVGDVEVGVIMVDDFYGVYGVP